VLIIPNLLWIYSSLPELMNSSIIWRSIFLVVQAIDPFLNGDLSKIK
jgi:hypothetical protein